MNKLFQVKEKLKNSQLFKIILINVITLVGFILIFQPVEKIDDYRMKFTLAGATTGEYGCHLLYSNIILGYILKIITKLFPVVSWYETFQYIVILLSFCVVTYLVLEKKMGALGNGIIAILLFVFGYEAYIKLTFSKTAGIASAAGVILLYKLLSSEKFKRNDIFKLLLAIFLIVSGALLRFKVFNMIFIVSLYIILFKVCCVYLDTPKDERKHLIKNLVVKYYKSGILLILIFCAMYGMKIGGNYIFGLNSEWKDYQKYNSLKAELQDYGWPDYDDFYSKYQELEISRDDYSMWVNRNYSDPDIFTIELMQQVVDFKEEYKVKSENSVLDFLKEYPMLFLKETTFYPVLILLIWYCMTRQKHSRLFLTSIISMVMVVNFYFYYIGRYKQHHIDVGMWFVLALIIIFCMEKINLSRVKHSVLPISILFIAWFINNNYDYLRSNIYYEVDKTVTTEDAKEFLINASADSKHLYITSNAENRYSYMGYSIFEQIPPAAYSNIYCLADYMFPSHRPALDNFGVYNIYEEIVNNNEIYYFQSSDNSDIQLNIIINYIRDNYDENAFYQCVKTVDNISVYRIFSNGYYIDSSIVEDKQDNIVCEIQAEFLNPEYIQIEGYIYKENVNSYSQNIYLEMINEKSKVTSYQILTMRENHLKKDIMNGKYGKFSESYSVLSEDWDKNDIYNIILECEDGIYRIPIEVK